MFNSNRIQFCRNKYSESTTTSSIAKFNPQQQTWVSAACGLAKLTDRQLAPDLLVNAFANNVVWQGDSQVKIWNHQQSSGSKREAFVEAGVLICLQQRDDGIYVLLTRRSKRLKQHSGQICFPGGKVHEADQSSMMTAIRETIEEIGVKADEIEVFGQMPEFLTRTGFVMQPYIAWLDSNADFKLNSEEVEQLIPVPLRFLMDPHNHRFYESDASSKLVHHYYGIEWQDCFIWGATAAVIRNLYQRLRQAIEPGIV